MEVEQVDGAPRMWVSGLGGCASRDGEEVRQLTHPAVLGCHQSRSGPAQQHCPLVVLNSKPQMKFMHTCTHTHHMTHLGVELGRKSAFHGYS